MEHHTPESMIASPHSETCFQLQEFIRVRHDRDFSPGSYGCKPSAISLSYPAIMHGLLFVALNARSMIGSLSDSWPAEGNPSFVG